MKVAVREELKNLNIPCWNKNHQYYIPAEELDGAEYIKSAGELIRVRLSSGAIVGVYSIDVDFID